MENEREGEDTLSVKENIPVASSNELSNQNHFEQASLSENRGSTAKRFDTAAAGQTRAAGQTQAPPPSSTRIDILLSKFEDLRGAGEKETRNEGDGPTLQSLANNRPVNENLLDGFSMLRLAQLLNLDIYYIGAGSEKDSPPAEPPPRKLTSQVLEIEENFAQVREKSSFEGENKQILLDEVAQLNPLRKYLANSRLLRAICKCLKILLSLIAIMISIDQTLSTIVLCLLSRDDLKLNELDRPDVGIIDYKSSDVTMSWFVLVLIKLSSTYIIFSTVFNGHFLWQLLSQNLFLIDRTYQCKLMLKMFVFIYLEYIINISFVNNLYGWSFIMDGVDQTNGNRNYVAGSGGGPSGNQVTSKQFVHGSYGVLVNLQVFVTEHDDANNLVDIVLTIFQFARGIIRMSPYITINYVICCLKEHINTIRNQNLLTDSLKKRQKLRLAVKSRRVQFRNSTTSKLNGQVAPLNRTTSSSFQSSNMRKKRVIFATDESGRLCPAAQQPNESLRSSATSSFTESPNGSRSPSPFSSITKAAAAAAATNTTKLSSPAVASDEESENSPTRKQPKLKRNHVFLDRIKDFAELESYITNLYIFTGHLNRLMSRQGLVVFFIVHNLLVSCSLIVPEAIRGGPFMVQAIRLLVIIIGIVPFVCGQLLNGQLQQLSKQIDRIIIQQQFIGRRRDNLVRIRELLHDIRVNCGGMLNFNMATGIKYLVVAFASAFFIEQEGELFFQRVIFAPQT